jgi:hypothetical protein
MFRSYLIIIFLILFASPLKPQLYKFQKLNINDSIANGSIVVHANTNFDIGKLSNVFDGDTLSLARTPGINPLIITLSFTDTLLFVKSRIYTSGGNGIWIIETSLTQSDLDLKKDSYKLLTNDSALVANQWDSSEFSRTPVRFVRLTLFKTTEDNYVRLNEWELYEYISLAYLKPEPDSIVLKPAWQMKIRKVWALSEEDTTFLDNDKIKWSSSDTSIAYVDDEGVVFGVSAGKAVITAENNNLKGTCKVVVNTGSRSTDPGDLIVTYISRLPSIDFVWGSWNPTQDGWPKEGDTVTWQAHILNLSKNFYKNVDYVWSIDGQPVEIGNADLAPFSTTDIDFRRIWNFDRHLITFRIDPDSLILQTERLNDERSIYSDAISAGFYVEESFYNYFREYQNLLGIGSDSFEDWVDRQIKIINSLLEHRDSSSTGKWVKDRLRTDEIIVVPDDSLNTLNYDDKRVDLIQEFSTLWLHTGIYYNHTERSLFNPFYFNRKLLQDILGARYLINTQGFDIIDDGNGSVVALRENGKFVAGSEFMPLMKWNYLYTTPYKGIMYGTNLDSLFIDEYSKEALNQIAGYRAVLGNYNPPGNSGSYLIDLPLNNFVKFYDSTSTDSLMPFADVKVFRSSGKQGVMYGKYYDSIPDMEMTADSHGQANLGNCPFDKYGAIRYGMDDANVVVILRVEYKDKVGYTFLDVSELNMQYWKGNKDTAYYDKPVNMLINPASVAEGSISENNLFEIYNNISLTPVIIFNLLKPGNVSINIYDLRGKEVCRTINSYFGIGEHEIVLDDLSLPEGVYLCKVSAGERYEVKKLLIY